MLEVNLLIVIAILIGFLVKAGKKQKIVDKLSISYRQGYSDGYNSASNNQNGQVVPALSSENQNATSTPLSPDNVAQPVQNIATNITPQPQPILVDDVAAKEKSKLQNINIALYVAGILLVGGVALFVSLAEFSGLFKYIFVWIIVVTYYLIGFELKDKVPILKPAAVAFVCTALAILPFTGLFMYSLVAQDPTLCWFVTSIIAFIAYIYASIRLNSQTLAYISIASFISLATSTVSTIGVGVLWYCVVVILIATAFTFITRFWLNLVTELFKKPITYSGQFLVPITLLASVIRYMDISLSEYVVIFGISALYYLSNALSLKRGDSSRSLYLFMTRLLFTVTGLIFAYNVSKSWVVVSYTFFVFGLLQLLYSTTMLPKKACSLDNQNEIWLWLGGLMTIISPVFLITNASWKEAWVIYLVSIGVSSVVSSVWLRRAEICIFTLFSLLVLPLLELLIIPKMGWDLLMIIYLVMMCLSFAIKFILRKNQLSSSQKIILNLYIFLFMAAMILASVANIQQYLVLQTVVWLIASAIFYAYYVIDKEINLVVIGNSSLLMCIVQFTRLFNLQNMDQYNLIAWLSLAIFFSVSLIIRQLGQKSGKTYDIMWATSVIAAGIAGLVTMYMGSAGFHAITNSTLSTSQLTYISSSLVTCCVGLVLIFQDYLLKKPRYCDVSAILITLGLTAVVDVLYPNIHSLFYVHWWVLVIGILAYVYYRFNEKPKAKFRLICALSLLSMFTISYAFGGEISYRLLFLIEHSLLVVIGLLASYKLLTVWGGVGVTLALLWMLSGYTFLLLSFIGLVIIAIVVYVIMKGNHNNHEIGQKP